MFLTKYNQNNNILLGDLNMASIFWKTSLFQEPFRLVSNAILGLIFTTVGTILSQVTVGEGFSTSDTILLLGFVQESEAKL